MDDWKCPHCGSDNESEFIVCWHCQYTKQQAEEAESQNNAWWGTQHEAERQQEQLAKNLLKDESNLARIEKLIHRAESMADQVEKLIDSLNNR